MKKLLLFSILISVCAVESCSRSSNDSESTNTDFQGTWIISKRDYLSGVDGKYIRTYTPNSCEAKSTFTFTKEKLISHKFDMHGGNTCIDEGSDTATYRYDSSEKILYTYAGTDNEIYDVQSFKGNSFQLKSKVVWNDYNNDGVKDYELLYFVKQ